MLKSGLPRVRAGDGQRSALRRTAVPAPLRGTLQREWLQDHRIIAGSFGVEEPGPKSGLTIHQHRSLCDEDRLVALNVPAKADLLHHAFDAGIGQLTNCRVDMSLPAPSDPGSARPAAVADFPLISMETARALSVRAA